MKYKIKTWIPIEVEKGYDIIHDTLEEAIKEQENLSCMQPENRYEIVEVKEWKQASAKDLIELKSECNKKHNEIMKDKSLTKKQKDKAIKEIEKYYEKECHNLFR